MADLRHKHAHAGVGGADGQGGDESGGEDDGQGRRYGNQTPAEKQRDTGNHGHLPSAKLGRQIAADYTGWQTGNQVQCGNPGGFLEPNLEPGVCF